MMRRRGVGDAGKGGAFAQAEAGNAIAGQQRKAGADQGLPQVAMVVRGAFG
ncbi:hypothetical protein D3C87_1979460 [compost metagenome]